ncbi:MAG TPA: methyltransferase domain-containing protein [bacterium]|nr:methyltransferase domain-containing protein [bacterium]
MGKFKKGDWITIYADGKRWIIRLDKDKFATHLGDIDLKSIAGKDEGVCLKIGDEKFYFFKPTIWEFLTKIKRKTQIIYPKDISVMVLYSGVDEKDRIIEAGTGSGSLLTALVYFVKKGKIISIEKKEEFQNIAKRNIESFYGKIPENIKFIIADVYQKFDLGIKKGWADKIFLDLPEPWKAIWLKDYLKKGGILCIYNPQISQIQKISVELEKNNFVDINVFEVLMREWIVDGKRARPKDLMRAHTGFILISRKGENGTCNTTCA